jgi:Zn-dependent peptidase ImmA (M78 family)
MMGKADARKQARKILDQYRSARGGERGLEDYETNPKAIAKYLGIRVVPYKFSDNISGVFFRKGGNLYLGVNSKHNKHRQRFTIAHEIGHFILHSHETLHYDLESADDKRFLFRADSISSLDETEANRFASELLMPENLVRGLIESGSNSINELADRFNVSPEAMRYRLINLGYL